MLPSYIRVRAVVWAYGRGQTDTQTHTHTHTHTDARSLLCYRPSVCRLSVTLVRPTQAVQIFGSISTALGTLAIR